MSMSKTQYTVYPTTAGYTVRDYYCKFRAAEYAAKCGGRVVSL